MISEMYRAEMAIEHVILQFTEAWNSRDAKAFSCVFAENADFTNVFGQKAYGRSAIEKIHAGIFSGTFSNSDLTANELSVRFLEKDLVAADVSWTMNGATDKQGNAWSFRRGLMNMIMKKQDDTWQILIMHNMDIPVGLN